jgi:hypothetical protein
MQVFVAGFKAAFFAVSTAALEMPNCVVPRNNKLGKMCDALISGQAYFCIILITHSSTFLGRSPPGRS